MGNSLGRGEARQPKQPAAAQGSNSSSEKPKFVKITKNTIKKPYPNAELTDFNLSTKGAKVAFNSLVKITNSVKDSSEDLKHENGGRTLANPLWTAALTIKDYIAYTEKKRAIDQNMRLLKLEYYSLPLDTMEEKEQETFLSAYTKKVKEQYIKPHCIYSQSLNSQSLDNQYENYCLVVAFSNENRVGHYFDQTVDKGVELYSIFQLPQLSKKHDITYNGGGASFVDKDHFIEIGLDKDDIKFINENVVDLKFNELFKERKFSGTQVYQTAKQEIASHLMAEIITSKLMLFLNNAKQVLNNTKQVQNDLAHNEPELEIVLTPKQRLLLLSQSHENNPAVSDILDQGKIHRTIYK